MFLRWRFLTAHFLNEAVVNLTVCLLTHVWVTSDRRPALEQRRVSHRQNTHKSSRRMTNTSHAQPDHCHCGFHSLKYKSQSNRSRPCAVFKVLVWIPESLSVECSAVVAAPALAQHAVMSFPVWKALHCHKREFQLSAGAEEHVLTHTHTSSTASCAITAELRKGGIV